MVTCRLTPQESAVYEYVKRHGSITILESINKLGITDLQGRIHRMEKKGIGFIHTFETVPNRYTGKCRICRYSLKEADNG